MGNVGSHRLRGETPLECAVRELWEETGIVAKDLTEIGRTVSDDKHSIYVEFLYVTNRNKESIVLQEGETSDYKWVSRNELINMSQDMSQEKLATKRILKFMKELQR